MQVKVDVHHDGNENPSTIDVNVADGLQGLRLMDAAEGEAQAHAESEGWKVTHIGFVRVMGLPEIPGQ